jgi:flavin reductase (DIM6/NTAB) family NADH-FMN oxidoreductase RutF
MAMDGHEPGVVPLDVEHPIWDRFFTVAPLVLIGSVDPDGRPNLAPKHMAIPLGWENYYAFVCSPRHHTQRNIVAHGSFTVSFPGPGQLLHSSFAAAPRWDDDTKPGLQAVPTHPATSVEGVLVDGCMLWLECELDRVVDGFGQNSLIVGRIVAACAAEAALRTLDRDDAEVLQAEPLLAYVSPNRFAKIDSSLSFPFPEGFSR